MQHGHEPREAPLYGRSLEIRRAHLGADHPDVAHSLAHLGWSSALQRDFAAAADYFREALAVKRAALGADPDIGKSAQHLGSLLHEMDQFAAAEPLYLEALENWQHSLGPTHPSTLSTVRSLVALYADWPRAEDAAVFTGMLESSSDGVSTTAY